MKLIGLNEWFLLERVQHWNLDEHPNNTKFVKTRELHKLVDEDMLDFVKELEYEFFNRKPTIQFSPFNWNEKHEDKTAYGMYLENTPIGVLAGDEYSVILEPDYDEPGKSRIIMVENENRKTGAEPLFVCTAAEYADKLEELKVLQAHARKFNSAISEGLISLNHLVKGGVVSTSRMLIVAKKSLDNDVLSKNLVDGEMFFPFTETNYDFICNLPKLTSTKGFPPAVGGSFTLISENEVDLTGMPREIGGKLLLNCSGKNMPKIKKVGNVTFKKFNRGMLESLPRTIDGDLYIADKLLESLEGGPEEVGLIYNCRSNNMKGIENLNGLAKKIGKGLIVGLALKKVVSKADIGELSTIKGDIKYE